MGMIVHRRQKVPWDGCSNWKRPATRQLTVGRMGRAVVMMPMSEVGDGREGQRHEPTGLGMVGLGDRVHAALEMR